jgi:hypothetical protein
MSVEASLAATAVAALAPFLTEAGKKAAAGLGEAAAQELSALWAWVKAKATGSATALERAPGDDKAQAKLEGALELLLEQQPALADDLRRLIEAAKPAADEVARVVQTMTVTGDDNISTQSVGHGNTFNITRG